jgi:citrate lyase synthetase
MLRYRLSIVLTLKDQLSQLGLRSALGTNFDYIQDITDKQIRRGQGQLLLFTSLLDTQAFGPMCFAEIRNVECQIVKTQSVDTLPR